ncbi:MAG TPA: MarR family winged helix-turn-helix transcriptional regulator [Mycobacteriales bacterium]|nr:MarR family winged helix-turn-helix transcriptional regulator [Mycobacteriales bacterium]
MYDRTAAWALMEADHAQRAFVARRLAALGLHVGQEQLLMRLWDADGVTQSGLVARIGCAAPTLTKALQRLERVGLVRRERGGRPRVSRVYVTDAGRRLQVDVERIWEDAEQRLRVAMSPAEYEMFRVVLGRLGRAAAEDPVADDAVSENAVAEDARVRRGRRRPTPAPLSP